VSTYADLFLKNKASVLGFYLAKKLMVTQCLTDETPFDYSPLLFAFSARNYGV